MRIRGRRVSTTRRSSRTSSGISRASRWEMARRPSAIAANRLSESPFVRASAARWNSSRSCSMARSASDATSRSA